MIRSTRWIVVAALMCAAVLCFTLRPSSQSLAQQPCPCYQWGNSGNAPRLPQGRTYYNNRYYGNYNNRFYGPQYGYF